MTDNLEELERLLERVRYTAKYGMFTAVEHLMNADMGQVAEVLPSLIAKAHEVEGLRAEVGRLRNEAHKTIMDGLWPILGGDMLPSEDWHEINALVRAALGEAK